MVSRSVGLLWRDEARARPSFDIAQIASVSGAPSSAQFCRGSNRVSWVGSPTFFGFYLSEANGLPTFELATMGLLNFSVFDRSIIG